MHHDSTVYIFGNIVYQGILREGVLERSCIGNLFSSSCEEPMFKFMECYKLLALTNDISIMYYCCMKRSKQNQYLNLSLGALNLKKIINLKDAPLFIIYLS